MAVPVSVIEPAPVNVSVWVVARVVTDCVASVAVPTNKFTRADTTGLFAEVVWNRWLPARDFTLTLSTLTILAPRVQMFNCVAAAKK